MLETSSTLVPISRNIVQRSNQSDLLVHLSSAVSVNGSRLVSLMIPNKNITIEAQKNTSMKEGGYAAVSSSFR
jgi:hypothetical protein